MTWRYLSLQTKAISLIVLIVLSVLSISTYFNIKASQSIREDKLRNEAILVARELDIAIGNKKMLANKEWLEDTILELTTPYRAIQEFDVFSLTGREAQLKGTNLEGVSPSASKKWIEAALRNQVKTSLKKEHGERFIEAIVPIHTKSVVIGFAFIETSLKEVDLMIAKERREALTIMGITIVVIVIMLAVAINRAINRPIKLLVNAMNRAETGDLEAEVNIRSRDELGELGNNFNGMLKKIKESSEENLRLIARINRFNEELQKRVEAATAELAARNEELRILNEALFETQRRLNASERLAAIGLVNASLAHEIGVPLNSIYGYIQLMTSEETSREIELKRLGIIESQIGRVVNVLQSFLDLTRYPEPKRQKISVNRILEDLLSLVSIGFPSAQVIMDKKLDENLPVIKADPDQLQQVFLNLITNALDAMENGGKLHVETRHENGFVSIRFRDTGKGIPDENIEKVFDPLFTTKERGTGLGLSICNYIVKKHSGLIEVESEPGKGTTFTVKLPAGEEDV